MNTNPIEKSLLNIMISGNYISSYDIVNIGKNLSIQLDYKKRSLILQKLFIQVRQNKDEIKLIMELITLLNYKENKYKNLVKNYPNSSHVINEWIKKINITKQLIQTGTIYG